MKANLPSLDALSLKTLDQLRALSAHNAVTVPGKAVLTMDIHHKAVADFIRSAETLLSPVSLEGPMTKDECRVVEYYLGSLGGHCTNLGYKPCD